jgi:hypothetical protein
LQDFHFGVTIQSWKDNTTQYGVWKLPKFHFFLFCIMSLDSLGLNFFSLFCNMVRYWNAWKVGNWMFGLHVTTCFTYLLTHKFFDLVCSLTSLQKFIKYFLWNSSINGSLLWTYNIILGMNFEPWIMAMSIWLLTNYFFYGCYNYDVKTNGLPFLSMIHVFWNKLNLQPTPIWASKITIYFS